MLKEWPDLLGISREGGHKRSIGLKVLGVFLVDIGLVREDRGTGYCLHVNGGILCIFVPKRGTVFLFLRDKRNPDDVHEWHASNTMYSTQNGLDLVKYLCGGGSVQGQQVILWLLVIGSPVVLVLLLLSQEVNGPTVKDLHKSWSSGPPDLS
jgi:hypothetical protein